MSAPSAGTRIGQYDILEELGRGGMGVVFKAHDTKLNRSVALKFIPPGLTRDAEAMARFVREAQAAAAIDHPNICAIHDISETDDGQTFIVMGYYGGETLQQRIARGPIEAEEVARIGTQIGSGLAAAHSAGIVHRDIKPGNIILADDGRVRILDFGLAKLATGVDITREGSTSGTAAYMSPEQINGAEIDHRTDIWSLGVVLHEMLSERRPFQGEYAQAISYAILNKEADPIRSAAPGTPEVLAAVVDKALKKAPTDRFQSADEFIEALSPLTTPAAVYGTFVGFIKRPQVFLPVAAAIVLLALFGWKVYSDAAKARWARETVLPELESLAERVRWGTEGIEFWNGFRLAREAQDVIGDDPTFQRLWIELTAPVSILSDPAGALVTISPYQDPSVRVQLGTTPLDSVRVPRVASRLWLDLDGFEPAEDLHHMWHAHFRGPDYKYRLYPVGSDEVYVAGWENQPFLLGVDHIDSRFVPDFITDRFEVTNRHFKEFVHAGGYKNRSLWGHPFIDDGRQVSWTEAMSRFVDKTGQLGPSTWELGDYPDGQEDHPVAGVSWYEAAAYAQFVGKELPNIYQWAMAAVPYASGAIVPTSNMLDGTGTMPVGASGAMSGFGTYDMAGNVREWVFNATTDLGRHFILGGGWNDQAYAFNDGYAQPAFDRSATNGFRLVRYLPSEADQDVLREPIPLPFRDYTVEEPVSADVLDSFIRLYAYDQVDLNASVDAEVEQEDYIRQRVSFDASYGGERVEAFLFIPKHVEPPYQAAVVFPGDGGFNTASSDNLTPPLELIKAGRAVMLPILKGTFERQSSLKSSMPRPSVLYRDHVIMWSKDIRRSVDYLESRDDVDAEGLFFSGLSWGSRMAPIMLALEDRFQMAILTVAGLRFQETLPEADPWNFLPRVTLPVLMLNGEFDFYFPVETSQRPYFEHLGTPEEEKEWKVYPGGHAVPALDLARESLVWMDRWLGEVE